MYSMGTDRLLDLFTFEDNDTAKNPNNNNNNDKGDTSTKNDSSLMMAIDDLWCEEEYSKLSVSEFLNGLILPSQAPSTSQEKKQPEE
eukprot:CAMPEP_0197828708 /NCGR_PEP_ID=MMETSP1437-20131217/5239_1 /TAXON_ID=49252 ORGANISM="Eucampia antarctica, Strain CCMP1452" /NCGR_SAMPLE_ID=MMETSP1437 /ASSEMBLY_ACC=CAM_ASM_001096 /LENGTH=86 /DNA_ID=CAMNT_0043430037 /DNA_START=67 /DNA_END=327 /DNA_ORIENTATION=+